MLTEQITWHPVAKRLPDAETAVLVCAADCSEPVWIGIYEDGEWGWRSAEGLPISVTHWAPMPVGVVR